MGRIRDWMNSSGGRWVVGAAAAVVIIVAVVLAVGAGRGGRDAQVREIRQVGRLTPVVCKACKQPFERSVPYDQQFPIDCTNCNEKQVVQGMRCLKCKKIFEKPTALVFRCPHCKYYYDDRDPGAAGPDMVPKPAQGE